MPKVRKLSEAARATLLERLKDEQIQLRWGWKDPANWTDKEIAFWCRHFKIDMDEVKRNA